MTIKPNPGDQKQEREVKIFAGAITVVNALMENPVNSNMESLTVKFG